MSCSSSWSRPSDTARATSFTRATSWGLISSPLTATTPVEPRADTCSPAIPHVTSLTRAPAIRSASLSAAATDRVVSSMSRTMPRRTPLFFAIPTPRILASGARGRSPASSAITAHVLVLPRSSPATRRRSAIRRFSPHRHRWGEKRLMADRRLVAGLDLGSTKTCAVIAELAGDLPRAPLAKILGVGIAKNSGVRRGMVRDIDETTRSVAAALKDAERMAGARVPDVTCGIAGEHVAARNSTGVVAVSGEEITAQDIARVNEVARAVSLGREHELLHDIPQEYVVD